MSSLRIQRRIINALILREIIGRYSRHNIGFLWLILEPMMFTTGVTVLWSLAKMTHGSTLPITGFALTGYSSVLLWRNMASRCIGAVDNNLALMHHHNVRLMDVFVSRIVLEIIGATGSFIFLSITYMTFGWLAPPEDVLKIIIAWILLAWFGGALALFVGSSNARNELVEKLWHPFSYLMFPLSGAGFMVDWFPSQVQDILLLIPMVNGVELLRDGYFGLVVHTHYSISYLIIVNLFLTLLGLAQIKISSQNLVLK